MVWEAECRGDKYFQHFILLLLIRSVCCAASNKFKKFQECILHFAIIIILRGASYLSPPIVNGMHDRILNISFNLGLDRFSVIYFLFKNFSYPDN